MIEISKAALAEINRMRRVSDRADQTFRLGVSAGGCNDLYYTLALTDEIAPTDITYEVGGIAVAIERHQLPYFDRLTLDYSEDLMGGGFRFQNPQAASVCDCGNSFSLASHEAERWQLPA